METTILKLWHIGQWALCLGEDGALKIKLWEATDRWVYGRLVVTGQSLSQVYSCQS